MSLRREQSRRAFGDQRHRLDRGMHRQITAAASRDAADPRIVPDIGPVSPGLAKTEAVDVRRIAVLEHKDQLMLGAVERPHPAGGLVPHHQVLELEPADLAGLAQLAYVPQIHADVKDRTRPGMMDQVGQRCSEELGELLRTHLTRGHRNLAVLDLAQPADITIDLHVVRRVGENDPRLVSGHQPRIVFSRTRIAA